MVGITEEELDREVQSYGFEDMLEFQTMVAKVPVGNPNNFKKFRKWWDEDRSKKGLEKIINEEE